MHGYTYVASYIAFSAGQNGGSFSCTAATRAGSWRSSSISASGSPIVASYDDIDNIESQQLQHNHTAVQQTRVTTATLIRVSSFYIYEVK